jgi:hypothetical protein
MAQLLQGAGFSSLNSYRAVLLGYTLIGVILADLFLLLSKSVEAPILADAIPAQRRFGLHKSRQVVLKLSSLFAIDAFAGGLVVQSMVAYWFNMKFGVQPAVLGSIFFGANILAGISALSAAWIAKRIGLINTMVFTHIPSNILLILVPLMPTLPWRSWCSCFASASHRWMCPRDNRIPWQWSARMSAQPPWGDEHRPLRGRPLTCHHRAAAGSPGLIGRRSSSLAG